MKVIRRITDFSRASTREHWRAGYHDAVRTLRHPEVLERPTNHEGVFCGRPSRSAEARLMLCGPFELGRKVTRQAC